MKIWIENSSRPYNELSGKSLFCWKLAKELRSIGCEIVDGDSSADISLNVIRIKHHKSKIKVLRIDGVWHDTAKNFKEKNKSLSKAISQADGVIYQSHFSKKMADEYLGKAKCKTIVIHNGDNIERIKTYRPKILNSKYNVITFSRWRPHKRLRDIVESFLLAGIKDSHLFVVGDLTNSGISANDLKKYLSTKHVTFTRTLTQDELVPLLRACDCSIHLCWFDSCPNSVVEALCAGVPVVCNNVGGTPELVQMAGGYICDVDKEYDMKPVDLYHPPKIDRLVVARAITDCVKIRPTVNSRFLDIGRVALEYLRFFNEVS